MAVYEGEVLMRMSYVVDMDDEESAEYEMLVLAKEDFPEATGFSVSGLRKIREITV